MNILDENIIDSQFQLLKQRRISVRQIGKDISRKGIQDDEITPYLFTFRRPTFFTRDLGLFERQLCHRRYCLVCMAVDKNEVAMFIRRLLSHSEFNTQAKRMGAVIRLSSRGIQFWRLYAEKEVFMDWS